MTAATFTLEFEFTPTSADGDNYTRRRTVEAKNAAAALASARLLGWREFGARFTDNCVDWRVVA